jgi:chlorosome envelope protein F
MANDNNGVFSDLFNAVGAPIQNVADSVGNGFETVTSLAQTLLNIFGTIVTSTANTAIQLIQSVVTGISAAITPKK